MKRETKQQLKANAEERQRRLDSLTPDKRAKLVEQLISDFFVAQRATLLKWSALTGQSAQIDTGYISQHVASVVLAVPGQGFKGKGLDLIDRSEVKSAALLSGVDRPRWNHNLGTPSDDTKLLSAGKPEKWRAYLDSPRVFYVLFDRSAADPRRLRVRAWCVDAARDIAWRALFCKFVQNRGDAQYNLQLHPPVGYDDAVVVNTLGNLDFSSICVFEITFNETVDPADPLDLKWVVPLSASYKNRSTVARPYGGPNDRPSRLEGGDGFALVDETTINDFFPFLDLPIP